MSSRLKSLLLETALYVPLVALYYFAVLRLLGPSMTEIARGGAHAYAMIALVVLLGQAVMLDFVARLLMRLFR